MQRIIPLPLVFSETEAFYLNRTGPIAQLVRAPDS